ncbi:MAG: lipoyl(octanoyl) transferase, partial [Omnitrophica WOR_2 bacterium RBG_13_44_8b]
RGGDVTYHGPGQLTVYPIFDLKYFRKDINFFLRFLEQVTIDFLADFAIIGERVPGSTGVWVENKKIASIGIAVRNWITFHGLSINIKSGDLDNFHLIKPCGRDIEMTCLETELGGNIEFNAVKSKFILQFSDAIDSREKRVPVAGVLPIMSKDVEVIVREG